MMKKICIVGGGTAGLVTALILKSRFSSLQIDIVKSDKIGIIGVFAFITYTLFFTT